MGLPMLKTCCFCLNLHVGTLIIGYVFTIFSLLELLLYGLIVTLRPLDAEGSGISVHKFIFFVTAAVIALVQILCGILLIVGASLNRASLTLPWTIVNGMMTVVLFALCVTGYTLILQDSGKILSEEAFMMLFYLIRACVSIYCVVVVHSRHKQIMLEKQEQIFQYSARLYSPVKTDYH